ncbi:MAG: hypothetical protein ACLP51_05510 [Syntrophobacteraceae bacterium]
MEINLLSVNTEGPLWTAEKATEGGKGTKPLLQRIGGKRVWQ